MQVVTFLLKGYVGLVGLLAAVMVVSAFVMNVAPARVLTGLDGGSWTPRDLLRVRLEQRLILLDFALALLLASWMVALREGGWSLGATVGLLLVAVLLTAWRGVVVKRVASCFDYEGAVRVAARAYSDGLAATVFLGVLMAVSVFGGGPLGQGLLLLALTGVSGVLTLGAMVDYHQAVDPVEVSDNEGDDRSQWEQEEERS